MVTVFMCHRTFHAAPGVKRRIGFLRFGLFPVSVPALGGKEWETWVWLEVP